MQGMKRKFVYVSLYEAIAIVAATLGLAGMSGQGMQDAGMLAVATSVIAVVWNLVFNTLFERWEARQPVRGRNFARRVAHAVGFEGGLTLIFVPLMAWWLDVTWLHALWMDFGLLLFFLVYTFAFNWAFDRVFGLPASAMAVV
nr:PACE efflux transporter [uncultured Albidiferax sp.]